MNNVRTNRYYASHLKAPRGYGWWLFETLSGEFVFEFRGKYSEAKKAAQNWLKDNNHYELYVCP
jgi:hypothetical protein